MATYYALVRGDHIQVDIDTGQLEIYETKEAVENTYDFVVFDGCKVVEIEVKKKVEEVK